MTEVELRELTERCADFVKERIESTGEFMPMFHVVKGNGDVVVIATPWRNEEEKVKLCEILPLVFLIWGVTAYAQMSEAWTRRFEPDELENRNGREIASYEDKNEAAIVHAVSYDNVYSFIAKIERDMATGKATLAEGQYEFWKKTDENCPSGRMLNLLPPQNIRDIYARLPAERQENIANIVRPFLNGLV